MTVREPRPVVRFSVELLVLVAIAGSVWGMVWREYALTLDDAIPVRVIFEAETFSDLQGRPQLRVTAGETVYYRKAFCLSLDDPDGMFEEMTAGERAFESQQDTLLRDYAAAGAPIEGVTNGFYINGVLTPIPPRTFTVWPGCYNLTQTIRIPRALDPGLHDLVFEFTYYRNFWQRLAGRGVTRRAKPIALEVIG